MLLIFKGLLKYNFVFSGRSLKWISFFCLTINFYLFLALAILYDTCKIINL